MDPTIKRVSNARRIVLLRRLLEGSGLATGVFAEQELIRDRRTLNRWLTDQRPIPDIVYQRLLQWQDQPPEHWGAHATAATG